MAAFIPSKPLLLTPESLVAFPHLEYKRRRVRVLQLRCMHVGDSDVNKNDQPWAVSLDTFAGFESFCWRTQEWLCSHTAEVDGLGTFEGVPDRLSAPAPWGKEARRVMRGGRAFESATINVWKARSRARSNYSRLQRRRVLTTLDRDTGAVRHATDAVGISMKLMPRNEALPMLRADVHYFQIGGGNTSWWFSGAADLSVRRGAPLNAFGVDVDSFLQGWMQLCDKHRMSERDCRLAERRRFLDSCLIEDGSLTVVSLDRVTAFGFIADVVDTLLPAYMPLVAARPHRSGLGSKGGSGVHHRYGPDFSLDSVAQLEERESFGLRGGASCESTIVRGSPLGWWRFTLTPSKLSPAGRRYNSMRNDESSGRTPPAYL